MTTASAGDERELAPEQRGGDIPSDTLSNRLLLARTHAGFLTVKDAADRCGLNYGSWSNWERGARPRDLLDVVRRIADGLNINYEWLLFGGALLPARGKPTRRAAERMSMDTTWNRPTPGGPGGSATRPTAGRPKGRTDRDRPITPRPVGVRANYVDPALAGEAAHAA